jgi:hypothetical protein
LFRDLLWEAKRAYPLAAKIWQNDRWKKGLRQNRILTKKTKKPNKKKKQKGQKRNDQLHKTKGKIEQT